MLAWHVIASHKFSCSSCKTNPTSLWPILYFSSTWLRLSAFFLWFSCFMYFVMFGYFIPVFRWYYQRLTKDEATRKICWEWMWKDRPSDGVLHKVYLLWRKRIALPFRLLHFLIAWSLVLYRYSDRVKEETERLDSLDLEDLEVPFLCLVSLISISNSSKQWIFWTCSYFSQMDDDERYNRKLEAGLYTLQVLA